MVLCEAWPTRHSLLAILQSSFVVLAFCIPSTFAGRHGHGVHTPGAFDCYILSLQWTPTYCSTVGAQSNPNSRQCAASRALGFTLHGLWPQYRHGYPSYCATHEPGMTPAQADSAGQVFASSALARHEWKKHGTCTGLSVGDYVEAAREAVSSVHIPKRFVKPHADTRVSALEVAEAFVSVNPHLTRKMIRVSCFHGKLQEVRVCFAKDLSLAECDASLRGCSLSSVIMDSVDGSGGGQDLTSFSEMWELVGKTLGTSFAVLVAAGAIILWRWWDWWRRAGSFTIRSPEGQPLLSSQAH